jgi:selenocysteine-specific elongation factor
MMLAAPHVFVATRTIDVSLRLLSSAPHALKNRGKVHFHAHSSEAVGEVRFQPSLGLNPNLAGKDASLQMPPGSESFVRIRLSEPMLLLPGDRFIIRQFSPVMTIGGGVVLDAAPISRLKQTIVDTLLNHAANRNVAEALKTRIARRWYGGLALDQAVSETGLRKESVISYLAEPVAKGEVSRFGDLFVHATAVSALRQLIPESLALFHRQNPLVAGMGKEILREKFSLSPEVFTDALSLLLHDRKVEVQGDLVRLPGHGVVMKDEEAESKKQIEEAFAGAGLKVPALQEVLAGLKVDRTRAQKIVTLLLRERMLIKVSEELVFHRAALEELRRLVAAQKARSSKMDVALFKEMTGVSRKYAIPLLEYLDRERVTRRVGDVREIL